jgi:hypothetical protein
MAMDRLKPSGVWDNRLGVRVTDSTSIVATAGRWFTSLTGAGTTTIAIGVDYRFP